MVAHGMDMTSSSSSSMDGMNMTTSDGMSMMMSMQDMTMVFFSASNTALFSSAWTPTTTGQYAGTCIFLIILAIILRLLVVLRTNLTPILAAYRARHNGPLRLSKDSDDVSSLGKAHGKLHARKTPWRLNDALTAAAVDTTIAGVAYLLMIAVMTMNVGYFLSILGGVFAGSFALSTWTDGVVPNCV